MATWRSDGAAADGAYHGASTPSSSACARNSVLELLRRYGLIVSSPTSSR
jgi:hypothetical protein